MRIGKVGIVDYGIGNQISIQKCLKLNGIKSIISNELEILEECSAILLPGVGAFAPSIKLLKRKNLDAFIQKKAKDKHPIIGICLGMQLLCDKSYENGEHQGLGLLPGVVEPISKNNNYHIGWNNLKIIKNNNFINNKNQYFYFNHSYGVKSINEYTIGTSSFENHEFSSLIQKDNIVGVQFHPEKSQENGRILFLKIMRDLINA